MTNGIGKVNMFTKPVYKQDRRAPRRMKRSYDRKRFSRTADRSNIMNKQTGRPMRGGIRL